MESLVIWGLCLLALSLLLVIVEVFVPSAGLISIVSAVVGIAGLVCLYRHDLLWGISGTLAMLVLVPVVFMAGLHVMPSTPLGRRLIHGDTMEEQPVLPEPSTDQLAKLVGSEGTAITDLRPVGTVQVKGERVQARSETALVRTGTPVRITGVDGLVLTVRPIA